ncbi:MAG TPA: dienelactone hydrolase family protein [Brevundimonas sp.]|nr:dienelactone hydrolase family protein [Brevundimonas sp.]
MRRRDLVGAALATAVPTAIRAQSAEPTQTVEPTYEGMTFESHRKPIRAIHYRPVGEGRGAAIVMMHGSDSRITNRGPWHRLAMRFAADGYQVLTPLFTDAWPDDGVRPPPMMEAWRDVGEHAIDWFIARGVDRRRTGMFGYSLGSYVAVDGALGNSRAAAAVGLAGGTDVYTPRRPRRRIPVLIIRAENDTHVLPVNTSAWVSFLSDNAINVRVQVIENAGHIFTPPQWLEVHDRAAGFFNQTIGRQNESAT